MTDKKHDESNKKDQFTYDELVDENLILNRIIESQIKIIEMNNQIFSLLMSHR
ncbi:hypothetical protein [Weissella sagaensis]|uniref:hypothetical protein n=1 Tax=Weissella sagaensis TaxID=2559928 RepID=UPI0013EDAA8C|nr:hypothetical protein [Weissella sagaensis]